MRWTSIGAGVVLACAAAGAGAQAEPAGRAWTIGVLFWHDSPNDRRAFAGFKRGLGIAGREARLLERSAERDPARAVKHLDAFRAARVDCILALGTRAARAAAERVTDIPVVFTAVTDPVSSGVVGSWRGSGRNLAGNSNHLSPDRVVTDIKRTLPRLRTIAVLHEAGNPVSEAEIAGVEGALVRRASVGIRLVRRAIAPDGDVEATIRELAGTVQAIWVPIDFAVYSRIDAVAAAAAKTRTPLITTAPRARAHAVLSILPHYGTLGMHAVDIVDRIVRRGIEPGAIPVGTLRGRLLVIDLDRAAAVGLEIPIGALAAADQIVRRRAR